MYVVGELIRLLKERKPDELHYSWVMAKYGTSATLAREALRTAVERLKMEGVEDYEYKRGRVVRVR